MFLKFICENEDNSRLLYLGVFQFVGGFFIGFWNIEDLVIYYGMDLIIRKGDK